MSKSLCQKIEEFIVYCRGVVVCQRLQDNFEASGREFPDQRDACFRRAMEENRRVFERCKWLKNHAQELAYDVEKAGFDATDILLVADVRGDGGCSPRLLMEIWPKTKVRLQRLAIHATSPEPKSGATANSRVAKYIAEKTARGTKVEEFNRDKIATALKIATGTVSATRAWKEVAKLKKAASLPSNNAESAAGAIKRGDWDAVASIQKSESRQHQQFRE